MFKGLKVVDEVILQSKSTILSYGSSKYKAGFAGDSVLRAFSNAIDGQFCHNRVIVAKGEKESFVNYETQSKRGIFFLEYLIEHGIVIN